jgi:putative ABC transport system ATP-binding protein
MSNQYPLRQGGPTPLIKVARLSKYYNNGSGVIPVLRGIDMEVERGDMVVVMGPSGQGKSTLLFILGLLLPASSGSYHFLGQDVLNLSRLEQAEFRRRRVGFVFQNCDLLENSTVYENLEFPLVYAQVDPQERPDKIAAALKRVNLIHRIKHRSNMLSGGERQRVAVARALVNEPSVILADEPTGQLDRKHGQLIMDHFENIAAGGDTALVVVTHDPAVAERCTRAYTLEDGILYDM